MKHAVPMCGAIVAAVALLAAPASHAQDVRQEIDAIIKDYLATHPDELGEIVKGYMVKHPEAVGEIMVGVLKHRSSPANASGSNSPAPGAVKAAVDTARRSPTMRQRCSPRRIRSRSAIRMAMSRWSSFSTIAAATANERCRTRWLCSRTILI